MQYVLWDSAGTYCILFLLFFLLPAVFTNLEYHVMLTWKGG